jgi:phosphoribosylaminoimidazole-succinocarboxamide synthase
MGSVKDLTVITEATKESVGVGLFTFSDRYSVFDWGEMPDTIPHKGAATALLGAYFFEILRSAGISSHYKGLVEDSIPKKLAQLHAPSNFMFTELFKVVHPVVNQNEYNYDAYKSEQNNFLIPLEIIYRNSLPEGSSVFKRLKKGEVTLDELGFAHEPCPDTVLAKPIVDFSTKLEITDRYISKSEAQAIASLEANELEELNALALKINDIITSEFRKIGASNLDGKIETAFNKEREIALVDVLGTLDECRFEINGVAMSKEVARKYYRNSDWHLETERAKEVNRMNWKAECKLQPEPLPAEFKQLISYMYCQVTNEITGRKWFNVPLDLKNIISGIKSYAN